MLAHRMPGEKRAHPGSIDNKTSFPVDIAFLQSFVLVIDSGSFAEAARGLGLSPAAVTARVRALEDLLGQPLVRRAGRTVKATEAGMKILEHARSVLRDVRDLHAIANDDGPLGELRLGASTSSVTGVLPPLLRGLYARHPRLAVHVEPGNSSTLYHRVATGALDAAVLVEPAFELPKACDWRVIVEEPLVVLAPADCAGEDPLALLAERPFIRYDRSMWGGRMADRVLVERGIQPQERLEIDALSAIAVLVDQGLGVSLLPDWTGPWPAGLKLAKLRLPPPVPVRRMGLLWSVGGPRRKLALELLEEAARHWTVGR